MENIMDFGVIMAIIGAMACTVGASMLVATRREFTIAIMGGLWYRAQLLRKQAKYCQEMIGAGVFGMLLGACALITGYIFG